MQKSQICRSLIIFVGINQLCAVNIWDENFRLLIDYFYLENSISK
jgi:hypothetical protein